MLRKTLALVARDDRIRSEVIAPKSIRSPKTRRERFLEKVDTSAGPNGCHPWAGSITQATGYPQFSDISPSTGKKTMRAAHIVAWELANGRKVPRGKCVLHAHGCKKTCCNGKHLRLGTHQENSADARAEKRLSRRLRKADVLEITMMHFREGVSIAALSFLFNVSHQTIRSIVRGKTWGKVTGITFEKRNPGRPRKQAPKTLPPIVWDVTHSGVERVM